MVIVGAAMRKLLPCDLWRAQVGQALRSGSGPYSVISYERSSSVSPSRTRTSRWCFAWELLPSDPHLRAIFRNIACHVYLSCLSKQGIQRLAALELVCAGQPLTPHLV
jgi:hypothetical protein